LEALGEREVEAATVLQFHTIGGRYRDAMRVAVKRLRRRTFRRAVGKASRGKVESIRRLNAQFAEALGGTRPVDPLSPLCAELRAKGMTPTEIVELLDRLGFERVGVSRDGARGRVKERIERWNARQRC
jgi:hypothetical protein